MSPIYLFGCCGEVKEVIQAMNEKPPECPTCNKPMVMVFSAPSVISIKTNGIRARSKGYKDGYAENYRRRLQESKA